MMCVCVHVCVCVCLIFCKILYVHKYVNILYFCTYLSKAICLSLYIRPHTPI